MFLLIIATTSAPGSILKVMICLLVICPLTRWLHHCAQKTWLISGVAILQLFSSSMHWVLKWSLWTDGKLLPDVDTCMSPGWLVGSSFVVIRSATVRWSLTCPALHVSALKFWNCCRAEACLVQLLYHLSAQTVLFCYGLLLNYCLCFLQSKFGVCL